ncbi:MAG TPA: RNA polymerase sigma factor [Nitrospiria bacterium]
MGGSIEEREIIQKILSGQPEAYEALVRKHHIKMVRLCTFLLSNSADGEDAAQEIFLKAYRSLHQFRGEAAFSTWLHRITVNHCTDLMRARSRRDIESWEELAQREGDKLNQLLSEPSNPHQRLEASDLIERVLSHMPLKYKTVLVLREVQGLDYREIAGVLGCSVESVRAQLRRARENFKEKMRHFLGNDDV